MPSSKITIDARKLFDSGIGVVIQNVLRRLPSNWFMHLLVADECGRNWVKELRPNWETTICRAAPYSISEQWEIPARLRDSSLVWTPHYNVPLFSPVRQITTVHDLLPLAHPKLFAGLKKQAYARIFFQAAAWKSEKIICVSEFTASELRRFTGCSTSKIRVIPNGVDDRWFESQPPPESTKKPYFLFIGNVKPHKNLRRLVEAYGRIEREVAERLIIVGKREGFITGDNEVGNLASELGERVEFTGWLEDGCVRSLVAGATALVFPSIYEGFGLPPLEAMAAGCPVLVARAGSLPEVCGEAAIYFDPFNVDELADTLWEFSKLGCREKSTIQERGRAHAAKFSWDRTAAGMKDIFHPYIEMSHE